MRTIVCLVLGLAWLSPSGRALAGTLSEGTMDEFRPVIETLSKGVAKVLKARRHSEITVGTIAGPPTLGAASGPGFRQLFVEELQRLGIRCAKLGTEVGLSGEYRLAKTTPDARTAQVQFELKLVDGSGQILTDLASSVDVNAVVNDVAKNRQPGTVVANTYASPEATALAMGLTVDLDRFQAETKGGDFYSRDLVQEAMKRTTAHLVGGHELRSSSSSPYGLRVLVAGEPKQLRIENGRVFVELRKDDVFTLKLINDANLSIAGFFTLDGVNSFAFSEVQEQGRPKYTRWIVSPKQSFDLKGWHKTNDVVLQFKVTDFGESAAALVGAEGHLGTLSVVVRATWPMNSSPPPGEPAMPGQGAGGIGIGFGNRASQSVREDSVQRDYGRTRSIMTIHYTRPE